MGPDWGIGTPIRAIGKSRILHVGTPEDNPKVYGRRDRRPGKAKRGRKMLPRSRRIPGYGRVYFFTKNYGRSRTGVLIRTKVLSGRLRGYTVTYMHLAAVHKKVRRGAVVQAGQEIGLLGGTAVQTDAPHLHLSIKNRRKKAVDVGPLLGIGSTIYSCRGGRKAARAVRKAYSKRGKELMKRFAGRRAKERRFSATLSGCGIRSQRRTFKKRAVRKHRIQLKHDDPHGTWIVRLTVTDKRWRPKLQLKTSSGKLLYAGAWSPKYARKRYRIKPIASGKRGQIAAFTIKAPRDAIYLEVSAWKRRRPPVGGGYLLEIDLPCSMPKK